MSKYFDEPENNSDNEDDDNQSIATSNDEIDDDNLAGMEQEEDEDEEEQPEEEVTDEAIANLLNPANVEEEDNEDLAVFFSSLFTDGEVGTATAPFVSLLSL